MSGATNSVLARKIERSKRVAPASTALADFVAALGKAAAEAFGELLSTEVEAEIGCGEARLPDSVINAAGAGIYYWALGERGALSALATIAPGFAAIVGERLLGGELSQPDEDAAPSLLDHQMGGVLVDALIRAVNRVLAKRARNGAKAEALCGKRGARSPSEALADLDPMQTQCLTISLKLGGIDVRGAIRAYFSSAYLESCGLCGEIEARPPGGADDGAWTRRLRNNILYTPLPVSAVLGRIHTNVGALSRLQIGQVFELEPDAINSLEISAPTDAGPAVIARARLGSIQSKKAIKLMTPIDPEFIRGL
jgi:hypothetical protein